MQTYIILNINLPILIHKNIKNSHVKLAITKITLRSNVCKQSESPALFHLDRNSAGVGP